MATMISRGEVEIFRKRFFVKTKTKDRQYFRDKGLVMARNFWESLVTEVVKPDLEGKIGILK
ncbi:MAG: hypothetical protein WBN04_19000 [Paracoccaceae bacterium]